MNTPHPLISLAISSTFLVSCSGMGGLKGTKPDFVMNANGPNNIRYVEPIPESLIQQFSNDYNVAKCLTQSIEAVGGFKCDKKVWESKKPWTIKKTQVSLNMIKSGFRLSDSVCAAYFRRIGNQDQDLDHYSNAVNIVGGLTSAVMGATGVPAKSIAITAASFSGVLGAFESFDSVYHFSPDVQAVENMVTKAGNAYEKQLYTKIKNIANVDVDFYDAVQAIEGYQKICQTSNIRALVNQAIETSMPRSPENTSTLVVDPKAPINGSNSDPSVPEDNKISRTFLGINNPTNY